MPIAEPLPVAKPLDTRELQQMREALLRKRFTGTARVRYADGSENELKTDNQLASALAAIDAELARRSGGAAPSTILIAATKGLEA
jgi:hypothetical protein